MKNFVTALLLFTLIFPAYAAKVTPPLSIDADIRNVEMNRYQVEISVTSNQRVDWIKIWFDQRGNRVATEGEIVWQGLPEALLEPVLSFDLITTEWPSRQPLTVIVEAYRDGVLIYKTGKFLNRLTLDEEVGEKYSPGNGKRRLRIYQLEK